MYSPRLYRLAISSDMKDKKTRTNIMQMIPTFSAVRSQTVDGINWTVHEPR